MTAQTVADVPESTRGRYWTWSDLQDLPDGHRYEIIDGSLLVSAGPTPSHQLVSIELAGSAYRTTGTVPAGDAVVVDAPFAVELRPPDQVGPRRKS